MEVLQKDHLVDPMLSQFLGIIRLVRFFGRACLSLLGQVLEDVREVGDEYVLDKPLVVLVVHLVCLLAAF